ncbi:hypothetical protein EK0264_03585 [Epidermidibacterium keratini]|uniref:Uncharacterized protein n=1 Tax=Epidermidibacterium keratini TaxID=1891644 RepID=A0A7L4YK41_9ACTN|nr:hypothetical protein [Epidermidibacterium keratini]QHB99451.1 hypothetical protein EK0264_03585 [Epidermidibacterium keratini]
MSEFSDRAFVAGDLTGIRAFGVDERGRLRGVYISEAIFTPGENIAECYRESRFDRELAQFRAMQQAFDRAFLGHAPGGVVRQRAVVGVEPPTGEPADHVVASKSCECGYYAYFDLNHNRYHDDHAVLALIKGWGIATVGSRGFRASKARLLALVRPERPDELGIARQRYERFKLTERLYEVPVFDSFDDAIDAHPLTPMDVPTPETDRDFWSKP